MGLDDGVAFGVKGNSADRRPVTHVTRPARRVALARLVIHFSSTRIDLRV